MAIDPLKTLAERLDALPNGFPSTTDGAELRLLAKLYSPEEAALAVQLRLTYETVAQIAARTGGDATALNKQLKGMARRGLIGAQVTKEGLRFSLIPFVVGIYERQMNTMDAELARMFEDYYRQAFGKVLAMHPPLHRIIPLGESVSADIEVHPFESVAQIVNSAQSWGVQDCICRKEKMLLGESCGHPIQTCLAMSEIPNAFASIPPFQALTRDEALTTLHDAAEAGLVHTVSNQQQGISYICNCCTCSCGILRGMAELGVANVVARSAFVNRIDEDLCIGCELCIDKCQFNALKMAGKMACVDTAICVGCGVCALACDQGAIRLVRRPAEEVPLPPTTEADWRLQRAAARGIRLEEVI